MTAHQLARERIARGGGDARSNAAAHDLSLESQLNEISPSCCGPNSISGARAALRAAGPLAPPACPRPSDRRLLRRAECKHPHAFPGTRTGLSTQHTTHIYDANAEGVAKWSARIEKP